MVGGTTREEEPLAVYLRSGDIAIMTGPRRLAYHAIPRVMSCDRQHVRDCFRLERPRGAEAAHAGDRDCTSDEDRKQSADIEWNDECLCTESDTHSTNKLRHDNTCTNQRIKQLNKVIESTITKLTDDVWEPFAKYLDANRINMNIRQVFKPGQNFATVHDHCSSSSNSTKVSN